MKKSIVGLHLRINKTDSTDALVKYIKEGLTQIGVNTLVLEFNPGYNYRCFPELADGTFGREDAKKVAQAAKEAGIRIVPLFMCLGHQGWKYEPNKLLELHPEFKETTDVVEGIKSPDKVGGKIITNTPNGEFYCHSWCASNDDVYKYVFPRMDEIMEDFGADCVHVGMDETFSIAEDSCPRCVGKGRAELFARTINILHDHIVKEKGWQMMMWADRLVNAREYETHAWEADYLGIWRAIDMIPTDIIMCNWHYEITEKGFPSLEMFMEKGFNILPGGWRSLKQMKFLHSETVKYENIAKEKGLKGSVAGMINTCWATASPEYLEQMNELVKSEIQQEDANDIKGVASSLVYMANQYK